MSTHARSETSSRFSGNHGSVTSCYLVPPDYKFSEKPDDLTAPLDPSIRRGHYKSALEARKALGVSVTTTGLSVLTRLCSFPTAQGDIATLRIHY